MEENRVKTSVFGGFSLFSDDWQFTEIRVNTRALTTLCYTARRLYCLAKATKSCCSLSCRRSSPARGRSGRDDQQVILVFAPLIRVRL